MSDAISQLAAQLEATEHESLVLVLAQARQAMRQTPSKANIAAYERAKLALERYQQEAAPAPEGLSWVAMTEVHAYLRAQGYRISHKQVTIHVKKGKLNPREDGRFHQADVDAYAALHVKRAGRPGGADELESLHRQLQEATMRLRSAQAESQEWQNRIKRGQYLPRQAVVEGLTGRVHRLRADMRSWIRAQALDLVRAVKGDEALLPEAIALLTEGAEEWLDRYSHADAWKDPAP